MSLNKEEAEKLAFDHGYESLKKGLEMNNSFFSGVAVVSGGTIVLLVPLLFDDNFLLNTGVTDRLGFTVALWTMFVAFILSGCRNYLMGKDIFSRGQFQIWQFNKSRSSLAFPSDEQKTTWGTKVRRKLIEPVAITACVVGLLIIAYLVSTALMRPPIMLSTGSGQVLTNLNYASPLTDASGDLSNIDK